MSATDVIKEFLEASEAQDYDRAAEMLAEDFTFSGPVPEPLGKPQYVGFMRTLGVAFPDWAFNCSDFTDHGDRVEVTANITGTHTGDWDMTAAGAGVIPPTGKAFRLKPEPGDWVVREGKIVAFSREADPEGGVPGIMAQLGLKPPE